MARIPFNVDAYTARLIGRENVSKLEGAVVELVKNTYDADATCCILYYDEKADILYLADNGSGMTEDIIKNHWMTIGRSSKKENFVSQKGRIQTGEKGIGRFALDRIADRCQMLTCTSDGCSKLLWTVDWRSFSNGKNITEIGADLDETELDFAHFLDGCTNGNVVRLIQKKWKTNGTIFKLTGLRDDWRELIHTIRENLASLIPYELSAVYKIYCFGNEDTEETAEVFSDLESFSYDYKIEFEVSKQFEVDTKLWRNEFNFGRDEDNILKKAELIEEKEYFHNMPIKKSYKFDEIVPKVDEKGKETLGVFKGIFYFAKKSQTRRDKERFYQKDITGRVDVRDTFGGIKLYRDNFRVRPYGDPKSSAYDWLQLARRKAGSPAGVASKGIWRVNADQMVGSIFISRINIALPDQSNREGIVETPEFRLLQEFLKGILEILEKDRQHVLRKLAELYEKEHPAKKIQEEINRKAEKQEEKDRKARIHGSVVVSGEQETEQSEETVSALAAKQVLDAKDEQIVELENEIKMLRALATTGIVTNTYIHEFKTLSHHLSLKIVMAKEAIEEDKDMETACVYINQANEIREGFNSWFQVTIESLKKDKRRRRKTDITQIISEAAESWNKTLHSKHIEIIFQGDPQQKLYMRCFPYEIDTILTNLISNSTASFEKIKTSEKKIYIDVKTENEYIRIDYSDTGAGLDAIYKNNPEKTLEVFETDKRNASGEKIGTGMGLWIVNNTVQEYGGKIDLSRNITEKTGYYITIFFKKLEMINNV